MLRQDKWRLLVVVGVIALGLIAVFPIEGKIKLGLDLKGGAHIVVQAVETESVKVDDDSVNRLLAVLRNRIDQYGVAEPVIQRQGADRIAIDLPGVEDPETAIDLIGRTAVLEFRQVIESSPSVPPGPIRKNYDNDEQFATAQGRWEEARKNAETFADRMAERAPTDSKNIVGRDEEGRVYLLGSSYVGGRELSDARATYDQFGKPAVSLKFNSEGGTLFEKATEENVGRQLAIVLDGVVVSAPVVERKISGGEAQITGNFRVEDAAKLAIMLRAGALPVGVEILENRSVGPTLGVDSIRSGIMAGFIGAALVVFFMILYYSFLGFAADMALLVSILLVVAAMVLLRSTLTLPGIGGIILTIGMAVDGNILIYERMKEEFRAGKTRMAALDAGFRKALVVILDSNITTLIAAGVLFYFGTGPVRGFAVTLSIGVVSAVFCNVVVTRAILQALLGRFKNLAL